MMKKLLGLVFNRWVFAAMLLIALSLVIWIVGPLVAVAQARPLDSERARWIAIAASRPARCSASRPAAGAQGATTARWSTSFSRRRP